MGNKYKLLEKIRAGMKNVRSSQLEKLMKQWEFESKVTKEGIAYTHSELPEKIIRVVSHREKSQESKVLQVYVKNCIKAVDEIIDFQKENQGENDGEERKD
ncbi:MAG: hypothetical protein KAT46_00280 [Deltaproteobacteria bacterium]|nr:hypothetical protein [Deltaproteobacteria bacterium]